MTGALIRLRCAGLGEKYKGISQNGSPRQPAAGYLFYLGKATNTSGGDGLLAGRARRLIQVLNIDMVTGKGVAME